MTLPSNQPIFIIGVHRSGTTLLRYMLSSHSRIFIPPESDFIPRFFRKKPHQPLGERRIAEILHIIFTQYRFRFEWQGQPPAPADLQPIYKETPPKPAAFLDALYGLYALQNGAPRWGDKTPIYASYVSLLYDLFPQAQFIHIIRDARDAAVSLLEKYADREFHIDIYFAARNYVRRVQHIQDTAKRIPPKQYIEVQYEALVQKPEAHLRTICDFLGEDFEPAMLQQEKLARERIPTDSHFFANVRNPINTQSVGRWREKLTPRDLRLLQHIAGAKMVELGYPLEDAGTMDFAEKLRMGLLQVKYETLQTGRNTMTHLGLMPPI